MDGKHTLEQCSEVTCEVLLTVFQRVFAQRVVRKAWFSSPTWCFPEWPAAASDIERGSRRHVNCFLRSVPAAVPAIAFLSGGQPAELPRPDLNAMK